MVMVTLLCAACEFKFRSAEDDELAHPVQVERYDRLESRYLTTGDFSALQQMNIDYPSETRTLLEKMLRLGEVNDPTLSNKFLMFYQDSVLQSLISDVEAEYANMDDINQDLQGAYERLEEWIPNLRRPMFYAQIGALDQSIIVGDKSVGISLDKYMGEDYPLYLKYYSAAQRQSMTRENIVPDCLSFYLLSLYPINDFEQRPQIDRDLHMAKMMWVTNQALGRKFYRSRYVDMIHYFMARNKKVTISALLKSEDYTPMK